MSQEKVTKYKEAKANRKEIMMKEKRQRQVRTSIIAVVCVAVLGWVGYSAVDYLINNKPAVEVEADFTAIDDYTTSLTAE